MAGLAGPADDILVEGSADGVAVLDAVPEPLGVGDALGDPLVAVADALVGTELGE